LKYLLNGVTEITVGRRRAEVSVWGVRRWAFVSTLPPSHVGQADIGILMIRCHGSTCFGGRISADQLSLGYICWESTVVICVGVVHHLGAQITLIRRCRRHCWRAEGVMVVMVWRGWRERAFQGLFLNYRRDGYHCLGSVLHQHLNRSIMCKVKYLSGSGSSDQFRNLNLSVWK
jgi:hypothetical protein